MNPLPRLRVYSPERGNGIIYGLEWGHPRYFFEIDGFLNNNLIRGEKGFKPFFLGLRDIQDYVNEDGRHRFDVESINLRHEFCEKGFAYPPENSYGTKLRAYMLPWNARTMIFLGGLIKDIPRGSKSGAWQDHENLQEKISPFIDIFYAIKDGLMNNDFCVYPTKAGFFDGNLNLLETVELKRYVRHGKRLTCDRD